MFQDALARFASAQGSNTLSVAHTDIIDTLQAGNDYNGSYFIFQVSTAFTQVGTTARLNVQLQTSDTSTFTGATDVTLCNSQTFTTSQLSAGRFFAVRIPPGAKRYIRAFNAVSGVDTANAFVLGAWNSWITPDIDVTLDKRYMLGQY